MYSNGLIITTAIMLTGFLLYLNVDAIDIPYGLRVNRSNSLPYWVFMSSSKHLDTIQRGTFVSFYLPSTNTKLAKKVVGLPGDLVNVESEDIYVNNTLVGPICSETPSGKTLAPNAIDVIPDGCLFVSGDHPQSFDSRYANFGLLRITDIQDVLWPLF